MGDAGEGLIDAEARIQERMEDLERERAQKHNKTVRDPERVASAAFAYSPSSVFGMRLQVMISRLAKGLTSDFDTLLLAVGEHRYAVHPIRKRGNARRAGRLHARRRCFPKTKVVLEGGELKQKDDRGRGIACTHFQAV